MLKPLSQHSSRLPLHLSISSLHPRWNELKVDVCPSPLQHSLPVGLIPMEWSAGYDVPLCPESDDLVLRTFSKIPICLLAVLWRPGLRGILAILFDSIPNRCRTTVRGLCWWPLVARFLVAAESKLNSSIDRTAVGMEPPWWLSKESPL